MIGKQTGDIFDSWKGRNPCEKKHGRWPSLEIASVSMSMSPWLIQWRSSKWNGTSPRWTCNSGLPFSENPSRTWWDRWWDRWWWWLLWQLDDGDFVSQSDPQKVGVGLLEQIDIWRTETLFLPWFKMTKFQTNCAFRRSANRWPGTSRWTEVRFCWCGVNHLQKTSLLGNQDRPIL